MVELDSNLTPVPKFLTIMLYASLLFPSVEVTVTLWGCVSCVFWMLNCLNYWLNNQDGSSDPKNTQTSLAK